MNKDNARDYLPLVQALAEGRVIEHRGSGGWYQINNPTFQDPPSDYRIKPEPREIWVNEYASGDEHVHESQESAAIALRGNGITRRYREVIE